MQNRSSMAGICLFLLLLLLLLLLLSIVFLAEAQERDSNISLGSSLSPSSNSQWLSASGFFAFGFYRQGDGYRIGVFMAGIPQKSVVWTLNRNDPPVSGDFTLLLSVDGRLALRSTQGQETILVLLPQSASSASMLNSGNFVIYDSDSDIIWQSFSYPTNTLLAGQILSAGSELFSSASNTDESPGIFRLKMQNDGHLVQYPIQTPDTYLYAYWASGTAGAGDNVTLHLEDDGHLYMLNATGTIIKNITNGGYPTRNIIYLMRIDPDGIFRLYSYNLTQNGNQFIIWLSSSDKCSPKGLCGLNGFCAINDDEANCVCLPGFAPVQQGNWSSGCERNFTAESCKGSNGSFAYSIQLVPNTIWEETSYFSMSALTSEDCRRACLEDCNCEAAMFSDRTCKKQRLPLKYGRRDLGNANIVLVKVANPTPTTVIGLPGRKKEVREDILILGLTLAAVGSLMLVVAGFVICKTRRSSYRRISRNGEVGLMENMSPLSFTYLELEKITNGFKNKIGEGAFGTVYKGRTLDGANEVAVKRLNKVSEQGDREFRAEILTIGKTHHRNLVQLLGYCLEGSHRMLVYQYMSNGSLADTLFTPKKTLSWEERIEIAKNIARGILYLHEECETQIIHCDIKPQNILIDEHNCPKISDFGLAKLLKPDQTKTYTGIRGTRGYVAPEWHKKLPITVKADVFSYGIVLLELIAARRNVDCNAAEDEAVLEEWAFDCFEAGEVERVVGEEKVERRKVERVVKLALWCIQDEPSLRPSMKKVLLMLEGTVEVPAPPNPTSYLSTI